MSGGSLPELFAWLRADRALNPPLDYLVSWCVQRAGGGENALRSAAVLWSLAAVGLLAVRAGGTKRAAASLGAAAAFLVLPASVHYGQEVRPYALALALVAAADVCLERARRGSRSGAAGHVAASLAASATLYFAFFPLGALWLDELVRARRERRRPPAHVFAAFGASSAFLAAWFLWTTPHTLAPVGAADTWRRLVPSLAGLVVFEDGRAAAAGAAAAVWALALAGIAAAAGERRRLALLLGFGLAGPIAVLVLFGWFWATRYFLFALLPLSFGAGEAWARLRFGWARIAAALLLAGGLAPALVRNAREGRPDWRTLVEALGESIVPADGFTAFAAGAQLGHAWWPAVPADGAALEASAARLGRGWIVRTPRDAAGPGIDAFLAPPWLRSVRADDAAAFRFEDGRIVDPASGPVPAPGGAVLLPGGGAVATRASVVTFSKDVTILAASGPFTDGDVSATVRLRDDLGSPFHWVGIAARRRRPEDGFSDSGILGLVRSNGEAVLFWPGGEKKAPAGVDPKAQPVRLTLVCRGARVAFLVDGREILVREGADPAAGWAGAHLWALGEVTQLSVSRPR